MLDLNIELLQKGDVKTYKHLFDALYEPLCQYAMLYLNDGPTAEDLVHELFIWIWEYPQKLNIKSSLKSYLFASVRNRCLNHNRNKKSISYIDDSLHQIEAEVQHEINEMENMDLEHLKKEIKEAIDALPLKCKEIFLMSRENELSYSQIAEELSISKKTVENQMGIALKRLKQKLSPSLFIMIWFI